MEIQNQYLVADTYHPNPTFPYLAILEPSHTALLLLISRSESGVHVWGRLSCSCLVNYWLQNEV